jgi:hypothetical protein
MELDRKQFMAFPKEIKDCLKNCGVEKVEFNLKYTDKLLGKPISEFLPVMVSELTDNCVEKGAKNIYIILTDNSLTVEDDVVEQHPEKTLKLLNKIKISGNEKTIPGCKPCGGVGIAKIVMGCLDKFGGNLAYSINSGRIVAEATWQ